MVYPSYSAYLSSRCTTDQERIVKINEILDTMYDAMADSATRSPIREYSIDSGQSKIETSYRSMKEMTNGIIALEMLLNRLVSKCYGTKVVRLRPGQRPLRSLGRF